MLAYTTFRDTTYFSGKPFRHGEKIRLHVIVHGRTISGTLQSLPEKCKESVFGTQIL